MLQSRFALTCLVFGCLSCGSSTDSSPSHAGPKDAALDSAEPGDGSSGSGGSTGGSGGSGGFDGDASPDVFVPPAEDTLDSNQNRLLETYLAYLKQANPVTPQSNGLAGNDLGSVCDLWAKLQPSAQAVFLTLSARLQGSTLGSDGHSMLFHSTKLYRLVGGDGATATDPGNCGGGENNRAILSMDAVLHTALVAAFDHQGSLQSNGKYDITDIQTDSDPFWRDSHDLNGPHSPFDASDETERGAPRAQAQYFRDPTSSVANAPLGRTDLTSLIDPFALELDQDYDCVHDSNPLCSYVFYLTSCLPGTSLTGIDLYSQNYGAVDASWQPAGC